MLHSSHVGDPSAPKSPCYNAEEFDQIIVTQKDGLLRKTVNSGLYTNWLDGEDREWMRFNGTYSAFYDGDGILEHTECVYRDDQIPVNYVFEVKKSFCQKCGAALYQPENGRAVRFCMMCGAPVEEEAK